MRRITAAAVLLALVVGLSLAVLVSGTAEAEPNCWKVAPRSGQCMIFAPEQPPVYPAPPGEGPGDPGGSGEPVCADPVLDRYVPCVVGTWYWSYAWNCWTKGSRR